MAAGYLALDLIYLEERVRMQQLKQETRLLRDTHNPFQLPTNNFINHFRLPKELVLEMVETMRPQLVRNSPVAVSPELQVLAALHFYATGSYQRPCAALLPLSQPAMSRCLHAVTDAINDRLMGHWIKFPMTSEDRRKAKRKFTDKPNPFPGAMGAIDCTHIQIVAPHVHEEAYVNHKGSHSLNVQVISDPDLKVLDVCARWPGSRHDSFIWSQSSARAAMDYWFGRGERDTFLIGDSGYPLEPWLLTPLANFPEGTRQRAYTDDHVKNRNPVERLFGVVKSYLRCLSGHRVLHYDPTFAGRIVNACFTIHNMRLAAGLLDEGADVGRERVVEENLVGAADHDDFGGNQRRVREGGERVQQKLLSSYAGLRCACRGPPNFDCGGH